MRDGRVNRPAAKDAPLNRNKKVQNSKKVAKKDRKRHRNDKKGAKTAKTEKNAVSKEERDALFADQLNRELAIHQKSLT